MTRNILLLLVTFGTSFSGIAQLCMHKTSVQTFHITNLPDSGTSADRVSNRSLQSCTRSLLISVPLIASGVYGALSSKVINKYEVKEERDEHFSGFRTHADDYMALVPAAAVFGLNVMGVKGRHDGLNQLILFAKSELIMEAIVFPTKRWSHVIRPDESNDNSFPSGHTAQAFVSAEFLRKEYGATHPWIAVGGYAMATSVGMLRMLNNKHWLPDVLAGAGIGILSVNLAYLTHKRNWTFHKRNISLVPSYNGTSAGLYLSYQLGKK